MLSATGARVALTGDSLACAFQMTTTDDDELLAEAFLAAVAKARELGWIV